MYCFAGYLLVITPATSHVTQKVVERRRSRSPRWELPRWPSGNWWIVEQLQWPDVWSNTHRCFVSFFTHFLSEVLKLKKKYIKIANKFKFVLILGSFLLRNRTVSFFFQLEFLLLVSRRLLPFSQHITKSHKPHVKKKSSNMLCQ